MNTNLSNRHPSKSQEFRGGLARVRVSRSAALYVSELLKHRHDGYSFGEPRLVKRYSAPTEELLRLPAGRYHFAEVGPDDEALLEAVPEMQRWPGGDMVVQLGGKDFAARRASVGLVVRAVNAQGNPTETNTSEFRVFREAGEFRFNLAPCLFTWDIRAPDHQVTDITVSVAGAPA
jgi:hypothetical protein